MDGKHADLGGKADQEQGEQEGAVPGGKGGVGPDRQREAVAVGVQQPERGQQRRTADLRQPAGQIAGQQVAAVLAGAGDQVHADGDRFPRQEEQKPVVGADRDCDEQQQRAREDRRIAAGRELEVGQRHRGAGDAGQRKKDARETIVA